MNVTPGQVSTAAVSFHVTSFIIGSAVEIGVLCLAGAPAVPTIPYVLIKNLACTFFNSIGEVAGAHGNLLLYTAASITGIGVGVAFVVGAAAAGIIGPLGIAVYSTCLTLTAIVTSARVLTGLLTIANGHCPQQV